MFPWGHRNRDRENPRILLIRREKHNAPLVWKSRVERVGERTHGTVDAANVISVIAGHVRTDKKAGRLRFSSASRR